MPRIYPIYLRAYQGKPLDGPLNEKDSSAELKPPSEEQSRNILKQCVSHGVRQKWPVWTDLAESRECRPHARCGAKNKKMNISRYISGICFLYLFLIKFDYKKIYFTSFRGSWIWIFSLRSNLLIINNLIYLKLNI